jgi:hypothetical protein
VTRRRARRPGDVSRVLFGVGVALVLTAVIVLCALLGTAWLVGHP